MLISTYSDGTIRATVFEYDRGVGHFLILGLFLLVTVLVGGKTGVKSLLGLAVTIAALFYLLIPLLFKGLPVIPTVFGVCALVSVACFVILGGVHKKDLLRHAGDNSGHGSGHGFRPVRPDHL